ncbi:hypothetical protein AWENTII_009334 [Aspergillus wentii]
MMTELNTYPFSIPLGIKETVFPEFHGGLPTAMLDYCAIFRLSTGIMERIGLLSETDGLGTIDKANLGFETADYLLKAFTMFQREGNLDNLLSYRTPITDIVEIFSGLDSTKSIVDLRWDAPKLTL